MAAGMVALMRRWMARWAYEHGWRATQGTFVGLVVMSAALAAGLRGAP